jgi:hypothetical protein
MSAIDFLRQDALATRVKGIPGGNRIAWTARDIARIRDYVVALPEKALRDAPMVHKRAPAAAAAKPAEIGVAVRNIGEADLKFVFRISSEDVDLMGDTIAVGGWDFSGFAKNPAVLASHASEALPIATSTIPWASGKTLMAIARFPEPGVSDASDEVAAAIRAKLVKGASVGFVPTQWEFSKDRPLGIDFKATRLLEWSVCSIPCNSSCLVLGAASDGKSVAATRVIGDPYQGAEQDADWRCAASTILTINSTDDAFDPAKAAASLLDANSSSDGTITFPDEVAKGFFAVDFSRPFARDSYKYPFAYVGADTGGMVASKVGWRASFAKLEASTMPGNVISDARSVVTEYERRLDGVKTAARLEHARALVRRATLSETPSPSAPMTREQRVAQAAQFRRIARGLIGDRS